MADLIARVSELVGDPTNSVVSAQQVQDALDHARTDVVQARLTARPTWTANGLAYLDYYAERLGGDWESTTGANVTVTLYDASFAELTPASADYLTGHWTLAASCAPPIYISGATYDVYAAAAALCEWRAAQVAINFDFSADGQSFSRSQVAKAFREQAALYWAQARPRAGTMVRGDRNAGRSADDAYRRFHRSTRG